jgi:hypothetical protein
LGRHLDVLVHVQKSPVSAEDVDIYAVCSSLGENP